MISPYIRSVLVAAFLLCLIAGCPQSDDIGSTLPVTGKITIDDAPVEDGNITFHPDEKKGNKTKAGVSGIIKSGEYTLTSGTVTSNKTGAPPGWYKVTISTVTTGTGKGNEVPSDPKKFDPTKLQRAKSQAIAEKFTKVETTPLEVEVKSGGNYELKATSK